MYSYDNYRTINVDFTAAIYCRLSREDEGSEQSESIKNQKDFLTKYVSEYGWQLYDIYIDDGFTGTNFERPDFKRLVDDIERGIINLVVTKDLSRLGRDYITTGYYIEKYFPEKNIRYIAVNDGIDTFQNSAGNDISPFRSVINDLYARDISVKVRSALDNKRKSGKFIGAFAPYGFIKDPEDKNKLIIDEETAPVVRRIFNLYLGGWGLTKIAHTLNNEGIITPTEVKEKTGNYKGTSNRLLWGHNTIKSIISNPTYTGCLTQRKYQKINYKTKKLRAVPKDHWISIEDTHEPIIDKETFESAREILNRKNGGDFKCRSKVRLFSGFIYCGDCGSYMTYTRVRSKDYLICSTYKRFTSKYCTRHSILEDKLINIIIDDIIELAEKFDRNKEVNIVNNKKSRGTEWHFQQELNKSKKRLKEISNAIKSLYIDKVKGILEEKQFIELNNEFKKEKENLIKKVEELENKLKNISDLEKKSRHLEEVFEKVITTQNLDRSSLEKLIDKIKIFENGKVEISYKFPGSDC